MSITRWLSCALTASCAVALAATGLAVGSTGARSAAALPQLNVTLTGKTVAVTGQALSGAVNVAVNTTDGYGQMLFVRLNQGVTYAQAQAYGRSRASQDLNSIRQVGAFVLDVNAPHGTTQIQANLQPGNYVALDVARQGPHSNGPAPSAVFTIAQSAHPAALPTPAATVQAIEFGFRVKGTLRAGSLVRWQNDGYLAHMLDVIATTKKFSASRIVKLLREGKVNQIPFSLNTTAGAGPLSWQGQQQGILGLKPGKYVLACFMNTQDGRDHTLLGMERIVTVR